MANATPANASGAIAIRDRIKELRRVRAADPVPNPKNWRRHPKAQADALRGLLAEIGYADALLARASVDRNEPGILVAGCCFCAIMLRKFRFGNIRQSS